MLQLPCYLSYLKICIFKLSHDTVCDPFSLQEAEVEVQFDLSSLEDERSQLTGKEEQQKGSQQAEMHQLNVKHKQEEDTVQKLLDELQKRKQQ